MLKRWLHVHLCGLSIHNLHALRFGLERRCGTKTILCRLQEEDPRVLQRVRLQHASEFAYVLETKQAPTRTTAILGKGFGNSLLTGTYPQPLVTAPRMHTQPLFAVHVPVQARERKTHPGEAGTATIHGSRGPIVTGKDDMAEVLGLERGAGP